MHVWQLQDAKAQLSEVVRLCLVEGPQILTVRGKEEAVIISKKDYEAITGKRQTLMEFMQNSPLKGVELKVDRNRSKSRKVKL